jgi:phosphate:Na+ symporter
MNTFNALIAIMATISLFIFSLNGFSKQLRKLGAEKLNKWLTKVTKNKVSGFFLGAGLTALVQSSSAVTSITVALVDSGIISFQNSLSVLIGSNLGTTFTAWLVTFKLDNLGPILLILGTIIGLLPYRIHLAGKSIFYLGLILFSLHLISETLEPVKSSEELNEWMKYASTPIIGVLLGLFTTVLVQSSSVTTGLAIILAGQGLINLEAAIAIVVGCNLGTTSTAFLASFGMKRAAKMTAMANFIFNFLGLILFLPFLSLFTSAISLMTMDITYKVAFAHLLFNIIVAIAAFPFISKIGSLLEKKMPR